ncbi:prenyltransferase/squalene oxidase repeat-containing protein [Planctomycetota bacterium]
MLCPHCGKDTPVEKSYCVHCEQSMLITVGQQVETVADDSYEDMGEWGPRLLRWFVGLVVLAFVLGFGSSFLAKRPLTKSKVELPGMSAPRPVFPTPKPSGKLPEAPLIEPVGVSIPPLPKIDLAFGSRDERVRRLFLERNGGDAQTEAAVAKGLAWLKTTQEVGGNWDAAKFGGKEGHTLGITGLALLAYLGAGNDHVKDGPYKDTVAKALHYVLQMQNEEGHFAGTLYTQGICTMAVVEAYGMTGDTTLFQQAKKAVEYIINAQQECGGWDYSASKGKNRGDTSVTGWQVMALKSAIKVGIDVPTEVMAKMRQYLRDVTREGAVGYTNIEDEQHKWRSTQALSAAGLNAHLFAGAEHDDEHVQKAIGICVAKPPLTPKQDGDKWRPGADIYFWYHGSLALSRIGGREWKAWNAHMKRLLLGLQEKDGSWETNGDRWREHGGKVYFTSLCLLALEVYYRYD